MEDNFSFHKSWSVPISSARLRALTAGRHREETDEGLHSGRVAEQRAADRGVGDDDRPKKTDDGDVQLEEVL